MAASKARYVCVYKAVCRFVAAPIEPCDFSLLSGEAAFVRVHRDIDISASGVYENGNGGSVGCSSGLLVVAVRREGSTVGWSGAVPTSLADPITPDHDYPVP